MEQRPAQRAGRVECETASTVILSHAMPLPVVVRTRDTTSAAFYEALGCVEGDQVQKKLEKNRCALGRDDSGLKYL